MGRRSSPLNQLAQEARAIELLASETEIPPDRLQEYWSLSADLINLVSDIDIYAVERPNPEPDDRGLLELTHRLRAIAARLAEIIID